MLFPEEDSIPLKKWIVKRLEDTSDADADVLADYVLALLRHDGDERSVRELCEAEIPDFLTEDSAGFVQEVFQAIKSRSYLPGATHTPLPTPQTFTPPTGPSGPNHGNLGIGMGGPPTGPQNGTRKRSYNERGLGDSQDRGAGQSGGDLNGRAFKQPRRGGMNVRGNFQPYDNVGGFQGQQQNMGSQGFPQMPQSLPGMPPFDPNNPMAAVLAMQQALGLPMPGQATNSQNGSPGGQQGKSGRGRCRDYDTKGFCTRGNSCRFEHGNGSVYVPPKNEEYDPSSATMSGVASPSAFPPNQSSFNNFRGNDRGRGRGRGGDRGDRGGGHRGRGGRSEFSSDRPNSDHSNTTIVVENIPEDKFSDEKVREFFSEFGMIEEVDMRQFKRLALIKYTDWNSASAAYNSPKVIFDNRFVKVYWYKSEDLLPQPPAGAGQVGHSGAYTPAPSEPQIDIEEFTRKQQEVQKAHEEKMKRKVEVESQQKELEKRQEELLKNQAEEKRKLMERIAAKSGKTAAPTTENGSAPLTGKAAVTDALKAQLAVLEAEAKSLGIDPNAADTSAWAPRGRGRGRGEYRGQAAYVPRGRGFDRGGYRGRGGGTAPPHNPYKLDNRPRKIAITGADFTKADKDESLRQFLLGVGEPIALEATPSRTTVEFKDRFTAEKFMYGLPNGELPGIGKLEMSWMSTPLPPIDPSKFQTNKAVESGAGDEDMDMGGVGGRTTDGEADGYGNGHGESHQEEQNLDYEVGDW